MQRSGHEHTIVLSPSEQPTGSALWLHCAYLNSPVRLTRFPTTLGSAGDCGVRLTANGVSPHHASIVSTPGGGYAIERLCSQGRLQVNGYEMTQVVLADGDVLTVGAVEITLNMTAVPRATETIPANTETRMQRSAPKRLALAGSLLAAVSGAVAVYAVATESWGPASAHGLATQMVKGPDATASTPARAELAVVDSSYSPASSRQVLRIARTLTKEAPATADPLNSGLAGPVTRTHTVIHQGPGNTKTDAHGTLDRDASPLRTALGELSVTDTPAAFPPPQSLSASDIAPVAQTPGYSGGPGRSPDAASGAAHLETRNPTQLPTPAVQFPPSGAPTQITSAFVAPKNARLADDYLVNEHTQTRAAPALAVVQPRTAQSRTQTADKSSGIGTESFVDAEASPQRRTGPHMRALQKAVAAKRRKEVRLALGEVADVMASRALAWRPQPRRHDPVAHHKAPPTPASAQAAVAAVSLRSPARKAVDDGATKVRPLASRTPTTRLQTPRLKLAAARSPSPAKQKPASRRHAPSSCGGR